MLKVISKIKDSKYTIDSLDLRKKIGSTLLYSVYDCDCRPKTMFDCDER